MKCAKCPLLSSWSNEDDSGESCGIFGDGWDSRLQYEGKDGIQGCYVDRHFIERVDREYVEHLEKEAAYYEELMREEHHED